MMNFSLNESSSAAKVARDLLASGRFDDESKLLEAALNALSQREKQRALTQALRDGRDSGVAEDFDPSTFQASMRAKYVSNV